jgi:preprotein translocase subunit SecF
LKIRNFNFDFIGKRKIWYLFSLVLIIAGLTGFLIHGGFNRGIDFLGGSLFEVKFERDTSAAEIREIMDDIGYSNIIIQRVENNLVKPESDRFIIRIKAGNSEETLDEEEKEKILDALDKEIGLEGNLLQDRHVDPGFGSVLIMNALKAVGIGIAGILIYVAIRFELRSGIAAIIALIHDVLVTVGLYAILNREINTSTIAAILTIIGYSINDTIVVYDRIRENTPMAGKFGYTRVVNNSINQTLSRSINTSLTTLIPIVLLLILGTTALKDFALALAVGIISGTYSSIFVASPILVSWNNRFPKHKK